MLQVNNISFAYDAETVISDLSFDLSDGKHLAVIGESGCGKSTLLKLIYGLYDLNQGDVWWNDAPVLGPSYHLVPGMPNMKYLAQDYDLMPYITVRENVGKYLSNMHPQQKNQRVNELLEMVEMLSFADTKAVYLSGGQQQRVALAKVLALEPELLLLDEPFSNIDSFRKGALRRNLFAYLKQQRISCIIATHDSIDALSFADETLVMKNGSIVRHDHSARVYQQPQNRYTASLFGEINEIRLEYLLPVAGQDKTVIMYATDLYLTESSPLKVTVRDCYFKGHSYLIKSVVDRKAVFFENPFPLDAGLEVFLTADTEIITERMG